MHPVHQSRPFAISEMLPVLILLCTVTAIKKVSGTRPINTNSNLHPYSHRLGNTSEPSQNLSWFSGQAKSKLPRAAQYWQEIPFWGAMRSLPLSSPPTPTCGGPWGSSWVCQAGLEGERSRQAAPPLPDVPSPSGLPSAGKTSQYRELCGSTGPFVFASRENQIQSQRPGLSAPGATPGSPACRSSLPPNATWQGGPGLQAILTVSRGTSGNSRACYAPGPPLSRR